jgi:hypothetical protein
VLTLLLLSGPGEALGDVVGLITEVLTQPVTTPDGPIGPYIELRFGGATAPSDLLVLHMRASRIFVRAVVPLPAFYSERLIIIHQGDWNLCRYTDTTYIRVDNLDLAGDDAARAIVLYDHDTPLTTLSASSAILAEPGVVDVVDYTLGSAIATPFGPDPAVTLPIGGALLRSDVGGENGISAAGLVDQSLQFDNGLSLTPGTREGVTFLNDVQHTPEPVGPVLIALAGALIRPRRRAIDAAAPPPRPR